MAAQAARGRRFVSFVSGRFGGGGGVHGVEDRLEGSTLGELGKQELFDLDTRGGRGGGEGARRFGRHVGHSPLPTQQLHTAGGEMERRVREDMGGEANGGEGWETEVRGASRGGEGGRTSFASRA